MASIKLYNATTKTVEAVPEEHVADLIKSGSYEFTPGSKVKVVNPDGEAGMLDASEARDAFDAGFEFDTKAKAAERKIVKEYDTKNIEAGLAGFARGATFGLSDPIAVALGTDPEHLRRLKEVNDVISPVSEGVGIVSGLVGSAGTGVAGNTLGLASKATMGAGKLAERQIAKALISRGITDSSKSLASKIIASSAKAATSGATEGALMGAGQVLSENALGEADLNAENLIAGVGAGALFGGAGGLIFKGLETTIPAALKATKELGKSGYNKFLSSERAALEQFGITPAQSAKLARNNVSAADVRDLALAIKPLQGEDFATAFRRTNLENKANLDVIYQQADDFAKPLGLKPEEIYSPSKYVEFLQKSIDDHSSLSEATQVKKLYTLKKDLETGGFGPKVAKIDERGNRILVTNEAVGPFVSAKRLLDKVNKMAQFEKGKKLTITQETAGKLRAMIRDDINASVAKLNLDMVDPAAKKLFSALPKMNRDAEVMIKLKDFLDGKEAKEFSEKFLNLSTMGRIGLGGAAFGVEGAALAVASKLATMDSAQLVKLQLLSKMEKFMAKNSKRISDSVNKFVTGVSKAAPIARLAATKTLTDISFDPDAPKRSPDKDRHTAFKRVSEELAKVTDPEVQQRTLDARLSTLAHVAPYTTGELSYTAVAAVNFLKTKIPFDPGAEKSLNPYLRKWKPSDVQLAKFERYVRAVDDPISVIERFGDGIVDREGVEVLQNIYPKMYEQFRESVLAAAGEQVEQLPYSKRLELRTVLDISVDPSTEPKSVTFLQANFAPTEDAAAQQQGSTKKLRASLNIDNSALASATQNLLLNPNPA